MRTLILAIPSGGDWKSEFGVSLMNAMLNFCEKPLESGPCAIGFASQSGSMLPQNRHRLVLSARKMGATHILWLDDDMTFPPDLFRRLMDHGKPIVGANATTRVIPNRPVAVKDGKRIKSKGRHGLEEVDQVGMAVLLTDMRVFDAIPQPWFQFGWSPKDGDYVSEDVFFCRQARKAGFPVLIDHDLSVGIGHVGSMEFTHETAE